MEELLRPMTPDDVAEVLSVQEPGVVAGLGEVFPLDRYPFRGEEEAAQWVLEIADPSIDCLAVVLDGHIVGFAATRGKEFLHFGIAVERWGSGLAKDAHDAVLDHMRAGGFSSAWLMVFAGNGRGRRFYEKQGWRSTGERRKSTIPPFADLIRYERNL